MTPDLSPATMTWLHRLGHFGPTYNGETVKGWALILGDTEEDDFYERVYLDADALRGLAAAAEEAAAMLDALRELPAEERRAEVDRIASSAQFNGMNMLTGRFARETGENVITGSMWFHIGANMDQRMRVYIGTMTASSLGIRNVGDGTIMTLENADSANRSIGVLDEALKVINKQRADLGAYQNRLTHAVAGLDVGAENMQAAESRIRDADMAKSMVEYTKNQVLSQSGTAMLAQANANGQQVLSLLR